MAELHKDAKGERIWSSGIPSITEIINYFWGGGKYGSDVTSMGMWNVQNIFLGAISKYQKKINDSGRKNLKLLNPTGHVMNQQFIIQQLYVLPTLFLCVLYLSENKQRLVPLTA